ncbi:MAG: hypothetical protein ACRDPS_24835 [Nocardioides sp.]|uniref:hypothetical protein n=1 Tax=Nocardioides sp. TaxID=35761 RepID=UPI003D6BE0F6
MEAFFETAVPETRAVWLRLTRNGVEPASLSSDEFADIGLCSGWIDDKLATVLNHYVRAGEDALSDPVSKLSER